jgi:LacI family transcriptional regulator
MESIPLLFPRSCQDFVVDLTLEHLAGQGASTVALVSDDTASSTGRSRFEAFWLTVSRVPGLEMGVALLGSFSIDFGTKAARELLRHSRLPDAVVCGSDLVALGVVREFRQSGIALAATRTEMIMMLATPMAPTSRATASKALPRQPRPGIVGYRARYGRIRNPV